MPNIRTIFDNTRALICLLNPNGILLEANQPFLDFIGADSVQVLGKPFWEAQWWIDNSDSAGELKDAVKEGMRGEFSRIEVRHTDVGGNTCYIAFTVTPVYAEKVEVISLVIEGHETTALTESRRAFIESEKHSEYVDKENDKRLGFALNLAGIGIWEWDMVSDQVIWDDKQFELFGVPRVEGSIPLSMTIDAIHPDDRERLDNKAREVLEEGATSAEEFRVVHPDGSVHWLLGCSGIVNFNQAGSSARLIGVNMDITKSRELETTLRTTQNQLKVLNQTLEKRIAERSEQFESEAEQHKQTQSELAASLRLDSIGQLAGGVAHDFNNLLAAIGGNLELAALHVSHDGASDMIAQALAAVEAGANLNRRLLTFAQKQKLSPVKVSTTKFLLDTIQLLNRTLGEDFPIVVRMDPDLWDIFVDAGEIDSVIVNLALNARDAMPGGGSLTIETSNITLEADNAELSSDAQPGEYIGIFVTDTGTGMSTEVLERAVEPFYTTKKHGEGTGLGLSSVYGFVKESGGFLTLDSHVGKGTSVRLYLPRVLAEADPQPTKVTVKQTLPRNSNKALILVVEDEPMVRNVAVLQLEHFGYRVLEASNGLEAIDILQKNEESVDLVFSDVIMPGGMTGYELADWLTVNRSDVSVLLASGYIDPLVRSNNGLTQSNVKVLSKPYPMDLLVQTIKETMQAHPGLTKVISDRTPRPPN